MAISMQELSLETAEFLPDREVMSTSCRPKCQPQCRPECPPPCPPSCDVAIAVNVNVCVGIVL